jgi:hypothetical protein
MRTLLAAAVFAATTALPVEAFAQESTVTGAAGGAVTGAIVGGPVGAAVGGAVGAIAGTTIDPPPEEVVTYVQGQPTAGAAVQIDGDVAVGAALPGTVTFVPVPQHETYAYTVVNGRRVIVDPQTRVVVQVLD